MSVWLRSILVAWSHHVLLTKYRSPSVIFSDIYTFLEILLSGVDLSEQYKKQQVLLFSIGLDGSFQQKMNFHEDGLYILKAFQSFSGLFRYDSGLKTCSKQITFKISEVIPNIEYTYTFLPKNVFFPIQTTCYSPDNDIFFSMFVHSTLRCLLAVFDRL